MDKTDEEIYKEEKLRQDALEMIENEIRWFLKSGQEDSFIYIDAIKAIIKQLEKDLKEVSTKV